jgi:hypothetical protein
VRLDILGADGVLPRLQRHNPRLNIEIAAELLPHHMHIATEDQVGIGRRFPGRLATLPPIPLQRQGAKHDRLRRSLSTCTGRLARGMEQVGQHPDATLLNLSGTRIFGVVDEVTVQVFGDDPLCLRLHPGSDECRHVSSRIALQGEIFEN